MNFALLWKDSLKFFLNFQFCLKAPGFTASPKKYKDQEPPYLMRQICVLQWKEIKTKNSGATHHF